MTLIKQEVNFSPEGLVKTLAVCKLDNFYHCARSKMNPWRWKFSQYTILECVLIIFLILHLVQAFSFSFYVAPCCSKKVKVFKINLLHKKLPEKLSIQITTPQFVYILHESNFSINCKVFFSLLNYFCSLTAADQFKHEIYSENIPSVFMHIITQKYK